MQALAANPLSCLLVTLLAYQIGLRLFERCKRRALVNPVLVAVLAVIGYLQLFDIEYERYFSGAALIHFLLGPATVALAIPLYRHFARVRRTFGPLAVSLLFGALCGAGTAAAIAWAFGANAQLIASLAPKSVTTPIAMGVSEAVGGLASLTAAAVIVTGIVGAALGPGLLNLYGIRRAEARGLALGVSAHGIGTARALEEGEVTGAFSGLAIGLNGLVTAIAVPVVYQLLLWL